MDNTFFSTRLAALRKERGISQKEAAEALGISGALLSHYENGIRECGLSFLTKAAAYYDVSCDYLLGVSDTKRMFSELLDHQDRAQDAEFRLATVFRAAATVGNLLVESGEVTPQHIREFFAVGIYKTMSYAVSCGVLPKDWFHLPPKSAYIVSTAALETIFPYAPKPQRRASGDIEEPLCIQTTIENSEAILKKLFADCANIQVE